MNRIGMKIAHFTITRIICVDNARNKVYACVCEECSKKTWLGNPVFPGTFQQIERLMCWCNRRYPFNAQQKETLVRRNLSSTKFKLHMPPSPKEEWHRESQIALTCEHGHTFYEKVGKVMFDAPICTVCAGIQNKKPKHLAVQITSEYAKKHGYAIRQVSGWAGNSTQYQVTCKQHGSFDLSLRRIKSDAICEMCSTYKKSP
ncbi:hypothetical protein OPFAMLBM_00170 [Aeromonas phage avDM12-TAAL]|nr:hypothetical protein OPFAMLBM_00170 [Aeromonas phage avDM12-TAAL]